MDPSFGFPLFLGVTVLLLGVVVASGVKARLRVHIPAVGAVVISLGLTIFFAERLGRLYDIEAAGMITPIHLTLAKTTTAAYLVPIVTGLLTLRNRARKRLHLAAAMFVLALTVLTAVTGSMMLYWAPLLPE